MRRQGHVCERVKPETPADLAPGLRTPTLPRGCLVPRPLDPQPAGQGSHSSRLCPGRVGGAVVPAPGEELTGVGLVASIPRTPRPGEPGALVREEVSGSPLISSSLRPGSVISECGLRSTASARLEEPGHPPGLGQPLPSPCLAPSNREGSSQALRASEKKGGPRRFFVCSSR